MSLVDLQCHPLDRASTSFSSPTMIEQIALKLEKEAFVAGLVGGSISEINKVTTVALVRTPFTRCLTPIVWLRLVGGITNAYSCNRRSDIWSTSIRTRRSSQLPLSLIRNNNICFPLPPLKHPPPHSNFVLVLTTTTHNHTT